MTPSKNHGRIAVPKISRERPILRLSLPEEGGIGKLFPPKKLAAFLLLTGYGFVIYTFYFAN
jgi:hypothetical protein